MTDTATLPPGALPQGATIGILGGGQLGRMLSVAASRLGFKTCIFEPTGNCPASHVASRPVFLNPPVIALPHTWPITISKPPMTTQMRY